MLTRILFLSLLLTIARHSSAQTPTADFTTQPSPCREEFLTLQNTSVNADAYAWDFCAEDITNFLSDTQALSISGIFSEQYGYRLVQDNGQWHAFVTSRDQNRLYRLDFGASLENAPSVTNLTNPGNLLVLPEGIDIVKQGTNWYGFVGSLNSPQGIIRLDFGGTLTNAPTAQDIGTFGTARTRALKVVVQNTDYVLVLCDYSSNAITTVNFRESFDNSTTGFVSSTGAIAGIANPFGIELVKKGNDWIALVASYNNNSLLQLNFGADVQAVPVVETTVALAEILKPTNVEIIHEAGSYYAIISNETAAMAVVNMVDLDPVNTPTLVPNTGLPALNWLDAVRVEGVDYIQGLGKTSNSVRNVIFKSDCGASVPFSTESSPSSIGYTSAGTKNIELVASNATSGELSSKTIAITVSSNVAPDVDFTTNGFICEASQVEFTAQNTSGGVDFYEWDFADGNTAMGATAQHSFTAGIYDVEVSATGLNGCTSLLAKQITIYAAPAPDFTLPTGTLCTNGEQNFSNTTTDTYVGNLSYQWFVDNESQDVTRDLTIVFTTTGTKSVRLETSIPGCTTSVTKVTSSLEAGPVTDFTIAGKCLGETTTLTNTSSGDIAGYTWNFGNTETSTDVNPSVVYATADEYTISLEAESTGGCVTLVTKAWRIYSLPQADFTTTLPPFSCVGLPVKFTDTTPTPSDGTIAQWLWNFDGTITSDQQNPEHTYTVVTNYTPSLTVTTDQGCTATAQQGVTIEVCPLATASFIAPSTACLQQPIEITNTSSNTDTYSWDFCPSDFSTISSAADLATIAGLFSEFYAYKLVRSNNSWFGFLTSRSQNKLYRFDFNDDLESTPLVSDLGNVGGLLVEPEGIDLIENNGNWFGFVGSLTAGQGIVRLDFGTSLQNTPTATNLGNFGSSRSRSVKVVKQSNDFVLIIVDYGGNTIIQVNYRDSFSNDVTGFVFNSGSISGAVNPYALDLVHVNFEWIGILSSYNDNSLLQLNFGSDILSVPTVVTDHTLTGLAKPAHVKIVEEAGDYIVVVSNEQAAFQLVNFFDLNASTIPQAIAHASLPSLIGLDVIRSGGKDVVQGMSALDNKLKLLVFEQDCGASVSYVEQEQAPVFSYTTPGTKRIELTARVASSGVVSVLSKELSISTDVSPDLSFVMDESICASSPVRFTANSGTPITSYQWTFGDGQTGSGVLTHHTFAVGEYITRLDVVASNSCTSFKEDTIKIYAAPTSSFSLPSGLICTNTELTFTNNTVDAYDGNLNYQWLVDNESVSTDRNLLYTFSTGGDKTLTLRSTIPGCLNESIQVLTGVGEGPVVDFSIEGSCLNETIQFTNASTGSIAGYTWDLGTGTPSTEINPSINYATSGTYSVVLETLGTNGCLSTKTVSHQIFSAPQPDFNTDLPPFSCNGSPTQFNDLTPLLTDSNLESWAWNFNDAGATATTQSPQHTYAVSGNYDVTLTVTSDQGCSSQRIKNVVISESPSPVITNSAACVNTGVELSETSGTPASSWQWQIGNNFYFSASPTHVFEEPGNFLVGLVVTSQNGCIGRVSTLINVPLPVTVDFESSKTCVAADAEFTAITGSSTDPVETYSWNIQGNELQGDAIEYLFTETGIQEILLKVTTESGCTYAVNKAITILPAPQADFSANPVKGPPPLNVQFTNQSTNASSYSWRFNDATAATSSLEAPNFTFTEVGNYPVDLIASNAVGCESTVSKLIAVALPLLFVSLDNFEVVESPNGVLQLLATLNNQGNIDVQDLTLSITLSNGTELFENLSEVLLGGELRAIRLSTAISKAENLQFICLRVVLTNNAGNAISESCLSLQQATVLTAPYPNPARDAVVIEWVSAQEEELMLSAVSTFGKEIIAMSIQAEPGLNRHILSSETWQEGLYFIKLKSPGTEQIFRIIIVR